MSGPWEKYQTGPWTKYAEPEKQEPPKDKGFFSNVGSLLVEGGKRAIGSAQVSPSVIAGDVSEDKAKLLSEQLSMKPSVQPKELVEAQTAFKDEAEAFEKAEGFTESIGPVAGFLLEFGKQVITNPKGAVYLTAQSAANMAPQIAGMIAGGKGGALAGSLVGPGGAAVGAAAGAVGGGFAAGVPLEIGSEFIGRIGEKLSERGLEPTEENIAALLRDKAVVEQAISEARTKGVTTAAVDSLMTVGAGKFATGARRSAIDAARKELGDVADAAQIAKRADELLKARTLTQKVGRGAGAVGIETAGGGISEAAGQAAAYGKVDLEDVGAEMLGELGGSAASVPAAAYSTTQDMLKSKAKTDAAKILADEEQARLDAEAAEKAKIPPLALGSEGVFTPVALPDGSVAMTREELAQYEEQQFRKKYEPQKIEQPPAPEPYVKPPSISGTKPDTLLGERADPLAGAVTARREAAAPKAEIPLTDDYAFLQREKQRLLQQDQTPDTKKLLGRIDEQLGTILKRDIERQRADAEAAKTSVFAQKELPPVESRDVVVGNEELAKLQAPERLPEIVIDRKERQSLARLEKMREQPAPPESDADKKIAELEKERGKIKSENLYNQLIGKLAWKEVNDISPDIGKNLRIKGGRGGAELSDMVSDGMLDNFLPPDKRPGSITFDEQEATEYIKDKLRNKDHLTFDASIQARQLDDQIGKMRTEAEAPRMAEYEISEVEPGEAASVDRAAGDQAVGEATDIRYQRSTTGGKSIGKQQTQSVVDAVKSQWSNAPEVVVAESMDDTAIPEAVRAHNKEAIAKGAKGSPKGFFYKGKAYILADSMTSANDAVETLFHESLGHYGLRGTFGPEMGKVLADVVKNRKADVEAKARQYGLDVNSKEDMLEAAEEVLAEMAQTKPGLSFVKRAIAVIRNFLRDLGLPFKMSNEDIIQKYILPARAFVERGERRAAEGKPAASRESGSRGETQIKAEPSPNAFSKLGRMEYGEPISLVAKNKAGEEVGRLTYMPDGGPIDVFVREQDRRKGVATALYKAHKAAGGKLPSEDSGVIISNEARAVRAAMREANKSGSVMFDPKEIKKNLTPEYKSRTKLIEMSIDDFLSLSDEGATGYKTEGVDELVKSGKKFSSLPFLNVDDEGRVEGHEGRHRARALKKAGYTTMPVILRSSNIRWSEQYSPNRFDYVENWPSKMKAEKNAANPNFSIDFPVSREDSDKPYEAGVAAKPAAMREPAKAPPTDSAAFKKWFGDSKVVDENGEPLVMYHGSPVRDFTVFNVEKINANDPDGPFNGFFFSSSEKDAEAAGQYPWGRPNAENAQTRAFYLSIKNPATRKQAKAVAREIEDKLYDAREFQEAYSGARSLQDATRLELQKRGYDGIISEPYVSPSREEFERTGRVKLGKDNAELVLNKDGYVDLYERGELITGYADFDEALSKLRHGVFVAFRPEQIKSATDNIGTYDPDNPDIRYQRDSITGKPILAQWTTPTDTKIAGDINKDDIIYSLQNKMIDTKRVVDAITATAGKIAAKWNPYLQEELYHGRTAKQTKDFLTEELRPLVQAMEKAGVNIADMEEYLKNRHAIAYNAQVAKVNPKMPDKGSGIATADAQAYLNSLSPADKAKYEALAKRVDQITKGTRKLLVDSGLETQETIDNWEKTFPFYVPLKRGDIDYAYTAGGMGTGQGFDVRGDFSRRAMGSERNATDVLANIAMMRERAIVKSQKNRVAQALFGLAAQNPNPQFWLPVDPMAEVDPANMQELLNFGLSQQDLDFIAKEPRQKAIDKKRNEVVERINATLRSNENVLSMRFNGQDRYVFFNPNDPRSERMAKSMKNLDADQLGSILGPLSTVTRWMAAVNTQYNPIFGAYNFLRDVQGAALQLSDTPLAKERKAVVGGTLPALKGIYAAVRAERNGTQAAGPWAALWEEFQQEGGQTGFRDQFSRSQERAEALQKELNKITEGKAKSAGRAIFDWLSDYNDSMENAVRLSAYKAALDKGIDKQEAASIAKNLTVNFNRKGQIGVQAGALYAFFNAAVQGTTRLAQTLKGPAGKKIIAGGLLLGTMQAALLAAYGYDEEEPPEFVRERNLIIPLEIFGIDDKYLAFPMPLGYHVIPGISRILTEWALSGFKDTPERIASLTGMFLEAFNPIGNAGWSAQTLAPTFADPIVALTENKDWTGKPIARKDFSNLDPTPGYTRSKEATNIVFKKIAEYLNLASGGTDFKPGVFSPTPDQIEYLFGQATGGLGREIAKGITTVEKTVTGEDLPSYKIPLAGRFYGETKSSAAESGRFYKNMEKLNKHENEIKGRRESKQPLGDYLKDNPEARLAPMARKVYNDVRQLRKRREALMERGAPKESVQAVEKMITRKMQVLNDRVRALEERN